MLHMLNNNSNLYHILDNGKLKSRYSYDNFISLLEQHIDLNQIYYYH